MDKLRKYTQVPTSHWEGKAPKLLQTTTAVSRGKGPSLAASHCLQKVSVTWNIGQRTALHLWKRKPQIYKLGSLVSNRQLDQEDSHGCLQVEAVLQHLWLSHGCFGGQIDSHEALKLVPKIVRCGAGALLGFPPCHLQPVKALVYFDHLVMQPGQTISIAYVKSEERQGGVCGQRTVARI